MKALIITILVFAMGVVLYDTWVGPVGIRLVLEHPETGEKTVIGRRAPPYLVTAEAGTASSTTTEPPAAQMEPEAPGFKPPMIESLESLTRNWTVFPPSAFPRHVKLSKPVKMQLESGEMVLPAGSHAVVVGAQANVLQIAMTEDSAPAGQTFVHDTDLPAQVRASYDQWKRGRIEAALLTWKRNHDSNGSPKMTAMTHAVDSQGMPKRNGDGTYDLLLASMKSGQVTDIKLNKIRRWGSPQSKTIDGQPTWTVSVFYEAMVFCGPMDAEAQAQIRNGQIIRWIYPGSGEPVP